MNALPSDAVVEGQRISFSVFWLVVHSGHPGVAVGGVTGITFYKKLSQHFLLQDYSKIVLTFTSP